MSKPKSGMAWMMENGPMLGEALADDLRRIAFRLRGEDNYLAKRAEEAAALIENICTAERVKKAAR